MIHALSDSEVWENNGTSVDDHAEFSNEGKVENARTVVQVRNPLLLRVQAIVKKHRNVFVVLATMHAALRLSPLRSLPVAKATPIHRALPALSQRIVARRDMSTAVDAPAEEPLMSSRFGKTGEVIVSKIFPAGFGWQAASVVAGNMGFAADSTNFFLMTGAGDFAGVLIGHSVFAIAKAAAGQSSDPTADLATGAWLASAAFCSGTAWQPTVNFLHDVLNLPFAATAVGCGAVTGLCFFAGLRVFRSVYSPFGVAPADSSNLAADAFLSASIGGATGTFVATDVTFSDNVLRPFFGVEENMPDVEGMVRAGMSTSAGFLALQTAQNLVMPRYSNWIDSPKPEPKDQ